MFTVENKFPAKSRRWKWDNDHFKYGVFFHKSEESNHEPSAQCMFCIFKYSKQFLPPSKLRSHLRNKHGVHQNNSLQLFKQQHEYVWKQQNSLQPSVVNDSANKKYFLLSSLQITHVLMKRKKTFCKAESVIKAYWKIAANFLHGRKHAVHKVEQIPLSNDTTNIRYTMIIVTSVMHSQ